MFWRRRRQNCCCQCQYTTCCQRSCTSCCQWSGSCCSSCCERECEGPQVETLYYAERYIDIPMSTYYGEGYSEVDCCVETNNILREIANRLGAK